MSKVSFRHLSKLLSTLSFMAAFTIQQANAEELRVLFSASNLMVPVHNAFKTEFENSHQGVTVSFEPTLEYQDAMATALREALIGSLPGVGYFGLSDICVLASKGVAQPLDKLISADSNWASLGMPNAALDIAKCDGASYGVPVSASYMVIIFNKKLVAEAGEDANDLPKTWPDILALARKINSTSGGIALNYEGSNSWSFITLIIAQGGKILSDDGKDIAFDSEAGLRAMQVVADIGAARDHLDLTKAQQRQSFNAGTLGILIDSSSGLANYRKAAAGNFDIAVMPFPLAAGGKIPASGMAATVTTTDLAKQKLAWDYVKYSASVDGQTEIGKLTGFLPFNQIALQTAEKLGDYYSQRPDMAVAARSAKDAAATPTFPGPNSAKIHQLIIDYMQRVYTGALSPKIALTEMAEKTRALLK